MSPIRNRDGHIHSETDPQTGIVRFLYETVPGRMLLRPLIAPPVSKLAGILLSGRLSSLFITRFVRSNHISLKEYIPKRYRSFNDFFTRSIRPEARPLDPNPDRLLSPCDGKLTVMRINEERCFSVKGVSYTLSSLLKDPELAKEYAGGYLMLFRLSVDDYHHYCFPAGGTCGQTKTIPGAFHTVNPIAAAARPIYRENTRTMTRLSTDRFGDLIMMEVGAMMVGKITNLPGITAFSRGEEKGYFEFGGSTVLLLVQKDRITVDSEFLLHSAAGEETYVRCHEGIASARF